MIYVKFTTGLCNMHAGRLFIKCNRHVKHARSIMKFRHHHPGPYGYTFKVHTYFVQADSSRLQNDLGIWLIQTVILLQIVAYGHCLILEHVPSHGHASTVDSEIALYVDHHTCACYEGPARCSFASLSCSKVCLVPCMQQVDITMQKKRCYMKCTCSLNIGMRMPV